MLYYLYIFLVYIKPESPVIVSNQQYSIFFFCKDMRVASSPAEAHSGAGPSGSASQSDSTHSVYGTDQPESSSAEALQLRYADLRRRRNELAQTEQRLESFHQTHVQPGIDRLRGFREEEQTLRHSLQCLNGPFRLADHTNTTGQEHTDSQQQRRIIQMQINNVEKARNSYIRSPECRSWEHNLETYRRDLDQYERDSGQYERDFYQYQEDLLRYQRGQSHPGPARG